MYVFLSILILGGRSGFFGFFWLLFVIISLVVNSSVPLKINVLLLLLSIFSVLPFLSELRLPGLNSDHLSYYKILLVILPVIQPYIKSVLNISFTGPVQH